MSEKRVCRKASPFSLQRVRLRKLVLQACTWALRRDAPLGVLKRCRKLPGLRRIFPHPVELVPQARDEARFADGGLNAFGVETVVRPGRRYDVLFDHDRPHVVGSAVQGRLRRGFAYGEPRSLNVGDIVQHQPAHGDDAQVFERRKAGFHALPFQLGARRTENPRDEGDEAVIAFGTAGLQVADAQLSLIHI